MAMGLLSATLRLFPARDKAKCCQKRAIAENSLWDDTIAWQITFFGASLLPKNGLAARLGCERRSRLIQASPIATILHSARADELARIGPEGVHQWYGIDTKQDPTPN
jgi:hypothetical protein